MNAAMHDGLSGSGFHVVAFGCNCNRVFNFPVLNIPALDTLSQVLGVLLYDL